MTLQVAVLFCLLAVAIAKPSSSLHLGFRIPSLTNVESRIVGGIEAVPHEFPYQITLQYGRKPYLQHLCGGSILNEKWILTAAHCPMAVDDWNYLYIRAGKHSLSSTEKGEQTIRVAKVFNHEKYLGEVAPYDVSLLKLEKPLVFSDTVQPIALPEPFQDVVGEVITSGWGSTHPSGAIYYPDKLQKAYLPIVDFYTCKAIYKDPSGQSLVAMSNVCTGPLDRKISICSGDSGGPLVKKANNKTVVVGIASWVSFPCGTRGTPAVYTKVSYYVDWIKNIIAKN